MARRGVTRNSLTRVSYPMAKFHRSHKLVEDVEPLVFLKEGMREVVSRWVNLSWRRARKCFPLLQKTKLLLQFIPEATTSNFICLIFHPSPSIGITRFNQHLPILEVNWRPIDIYLYTFNNKCQLRDHLLPVDREYNLRVCIIISSGVNICMERNKNGMLYEQKVIKRRKG